jgi:hypothetical protein
MYREKLMLAGFGLGSANRSIRQARTADTNGADLSIFSCYEGRLTSSFRRAVIVAALRCSAHAVFSCEQSGQ